MNEKYFIFGMIVLVSISFIVGCAREIEIEKEDSVIINITAIGSLASELGKEPVRIYDSKGILISEKEGKVGDLLIFEGLPPGEYVAKVEGLCPEGHNKKEFTVVEGKPTEITLELSVCV